MAGENIAVFVAVAVAFGVTALTGFWLIPLLRRLKYGQTILDIGPKWHQKKQGIPTMGGLMFIAGILLAGIAAYAFLPKESNFREDGRLALGVVMALAYGMVGFLDDYIKVVKKRNLGLSARQKMIMQLFIAILYLAGLYLLGDTSTMAAVPFLGAVDLGILYYPLAVLGIVYFVNVVNITDGIDGLCASATFVSALGFIVMAALLRMPAMGLLSGALAGGCLGFLMWNFYPARIFMGDTGSMFLGGMVVALGFGFRLPVYLLFMGILYILEGLSVMLQVAYFKATGGKRIFKMSPIHHHFEMSGWSETKVVAAFSTVQLIGVLIALASLVTG